MCSRSYRDDLLSSSPLCPLLQRHVNPFGFPNGILIPSRLNRLKNLSCKTHEEAKIYLQKKYFGYENGDLTIPLYAFVGRITEQKVKKSITSREYI